MDNDFDNSGHEIKSSSPVINSPASDSADTEYAGESKGTLALTLAITGLCAPVAGVVLALSPGGYSGVQVVLAACLVGIAPFLSAASLALAVLANNESKRTGKPVDHKMESAMPVGCLAMFISLLVVAFIVRQGALILLSLRLLVQ